LRDGQVFTVAETGFGSGLNFLATVELWREMATPKATLHYISFEKYPLSKQEIIRANTLWPELKDFANQLVNQYPPVDARGFHRIHLPGQIKLTLVFDDATEAVKQLLPIIHPSPKIKESHYGLSHSGTYQGYVDAWYLDGFAPAKNPEMWTEELFKLMFKVCRKEATLATFTAAGTVRRGLQKAGFEVEKVAGYGRKREMLRATHSLNSASTEVTGAVIPNSPRARNKNQSPSWHIVEGCCPPPKSVAIIGAGLAGAQTAFALANKGMQVTVIDKNQVARGASGNQQGIVYCKLSHTNGALSEFNLLAYLFACRFYQHHKLYESAGHQCGVLQLQDSPEQQQLVAKMFAHSPELVQWVNKHDASALAGIPMDSSGLWFPQSGWFSPGRLCQKLLDQANTKVLEGTRVTSLSRPDDQWILTGEDKHTIGAYDAVVLACAYSAKEFSQCHLLSTKSIRGQISLIAATAQSKKLSTVLCGQGYITPSADFYHCAGATFNLDSDSKELSEDDHNLNLENAKALSNSLQGINHDDVNLGRVGFRCSTPDYLPLIGTLANETEMLKRFARYRQNSKLPIDEFGSYWPGLYANVGHGSKGLTSTPICAEIISDLISGEPLPLSQNLINRLHPARFLIRNLARNRL